MFRSKALGIALSVLGCLFIATTVYLWTNAIHRVWVFAHLSSEHPVSTDQIWSVSPSCLENYLNEETEKAKAMLRAHEGAMPTEVRAWINRPQRKSESSLPPADERAIDRIRREYDESKRDFEEKQYFFNLQSKHIKWFAVKSEFEDDVNRQQKQLDTFQNQERIGGAFRLRGLDKDKADALLGLTVFSEGHRKSLKAACLQIIPIKMITTRQAASKDLWHSRIGHYFTGFVGMTLLLAGLLRAFSGKEKRASPLVEQPFGRIVGAARKPILIDGERNTAAGRSLAVDRTNGRSTN